MENSIVLELLSAGVIAALVTGAFSLVIAIKNNKRLMILEDNKQKFTVSQERYKELRVAYSELTNSLPEEQRLTHIVMNSHSQNESQNKNLFSLYDIAEKNMKILYIHYQKFGYLLLDDEREKVSNYVYEIDELAKTLVNVQLKLQLFNNDVDRKADMLDVTKNVIERVTKIAEFEDEYFSLYRSCLSEMFKSCSNK